MSLASAASRMWTEGVAVFTNTGYSLFNIEAHLVCITVLIILFNRQQNSSDQTEARITWSRLLFVQILYCMSGIFRVLVDIDIIPRNNFSQYIVTALMFGLFGCLCWLVFVYTVLYQNSDMLKSFRNKFLSLLPFCFNVVILISSPFTGAFIDISEPVMKNGALFPLMFSINLGYPVAAVTLSVIRRSRMNRHERDTISIISVFPAFFMICGSLQALNWRIPFMCYAIMISDIFVYINYADSLVSVDPLTKIPNRNGLMRSLADRMNRENLENLYLFAVDVDDLGNINSNYGRTEGDRALTVIAEALQKFRKEEHECYISRYYGDEFIITADIENDDELDLFTEHIRNYISNAVTHNELQYHLRVSIGHAKYEQYSRTETISGLIDEAVRMLNENKEQRKFQTLWRSGKV